jgi:hypothetical protein
MDRANFIKSCASALIVINTPSVLKSFDLEKDEVLYQLNWKLGEKTPNGRLYDPEHFKKELFKRDFINIAFDSGAFDGGKVSLEHIIGQATPVIKDKDIYFKVKLFPTPNGSIYKQILEAQSHFLSTAGSGSISDNNTVNEDYVLHGLFFVPNV